MIMKSQSQNLNISKALQVPIKTNGDRLRAMDGYIQAVRETHDELNKINEAFDAWSKNRCKNCRSILQ